MGQRPPHRVGYRLSGVLGKRDAGTGPPQEVGQRLSRGSKEQKVQALLPVQAENERAGTRGRSRVVRPQEGALLGQALTLLSALRPDSHPTGRLPTQQD